MPVILVCRHNEWEALGSLYLLMPPCLAASQSLLPGTRAPRHLNDDSQAGCAATILETLKIQPLSRQVASCSFWLWGSVFLSLNLHISCCTKQWSAPVFIRFPFLNGIVPTPSSEVKPWTQLCVASQPSFRLEELSPHHHSASGLGVPHNCGFCLITIYYYYYYLCFYAFISGSQKSQFCFWHGYALCFLWRYFFLIVMYFK